MMEDDDDVFKFIARPRGANVALAAAFDIFRLFYVTFIACCLGFKNKSMKKKLFEIELKERWSDKRHNNNNVFL